MIGIEMEDAEIANRYVSRWFWSLDELAAASGLAVEEVSKFIAAGCAPGPIYIECPDGSWWSALGGSDRPAGTEWYSPGAAWGLRHAALASRQGESPSQVAAELRTRFVEAFLAGLTRIEGAAMAFPSCFVDDTLHAPAAEEVANNEWSDWLRGGYGVCLRVFTATTCLTKEVLATNIKLALASGIDPASLLTQAEELSAVMLPFAPWQRPIGTPGLTIDRILAETGLGCDLPFRAL